MANGYLGGNMDTSKKTEIKCNITWCKYNINDSQCSLDHIEIVWEDRYPYCENYKRTFLEINEDKI